MRALQVPQSCGHENSHASQLSLCEDAQQIVKITIETINNMSNNTTFCDLRDFSESYEKIHGFLSFSVCVFGSVANVLNICVLSSKEMRWPTNMILTGLAIADLLVMLEYIPFTIHRHLNQKKRISDFTYGWAIFMVFHALFSQVFHFISCCLTVSLAIWRYLTITNPRNSRVCNMKRTFLMIAAIYLICPIICSPLFVSLQIETHNQTCDFDGNIVEKDELIHYNTNQIDKRTIYLARINNKVTSFLTYGIIIKLIPCILLTCLSWCLVSALLEVRRRRRVLRKASLPLNDVKFFPNKKSEKDRQAERTSTMLLAVLALFLITELPQAVLGLLSVTLGGNFELQCYMPLGDLMDILALINCAINFVLYCTMSRQFRLTFREVFRSKLYNYWRPLKQHLTETQFSQTEAPSKSKITVPMSS